MLVQLLKAHCSANTLHAEGTKQPVVDAKLRAWAETEMPARIKIFRGSTKEVRLVRRYWEGGAAEMSGRRKRRFTRWKDEEQKGERVLAFFFFFLISVQNWFILTPFLFPFSPHFFSAGDESWRNRCQTSLQKGQVKSLLVWKAVGTRTKSCL